MFGSVCPLEGRKIAVVTTRKISFKALCLVFQIRHYSGCKIRSCKPKSAAVTSAVSKLKIAFAFSAVCACAQFIATTPASAITAELATKCRELSIKAYPPQRAGAKSGNASEARKYYNACVTNGGTPPDDKTKNPPPAPAR